MKLKIQAIRRKVQPSQFGGTWTITSVKFADHTNPQYGYDLKGFGERADSLKEGQIIEGYFTTGSYNGKNGPVTTNHFNKITAEYVYNLLLKQFPNIEGIPASIPATTNTSKPAAEWTVTPPEETSTEDQPW